MSKQLVPHVTPVMLRDLPDQTANIINRVIDIVNELNARDE